MRKPVAAAILAFGALSTPAVAAEEKPGRYTMTPAENGAVVPGVSISVVNTATVRVVLA